MDNLSKTITISKVESKMFDNGGTQYKITTTANEKFKFNDTKKEGGLTVAYQQFKDMGLKVGSTVDVWYKEVQKEYEGKPYTDRLIATFRENNGQPIQQAVPVKKAPVKSNLSEPTYVQEKDEKFWDKKALKQCIWGYWLERKSTTIPTQEEMNLVANTFDAIEKFTEARFATGWDKATKTFRPDEPHGDEATYAVDSADLASLNDIPF